ncbi:nose resistant to fluoxetine protein 6-like isoform X2 [Vespula pensylvanica]|uniref:nose resistant to fluoxetine protein 6-like isoform X2 n=1 Tax=Vespula pensylvanica TaxID=30213 RepID=UPI001CB9DEF3|nr:nose resistant to fluoxetine protein 6-like isoform X2 [Vespula pensylvanica]
MGVLRVANPRQFARLSPSIDLSVSFFAFLIFIFTVASNVQAGLSIKPETILLNVFTRPFKPTKWSTDECQRDSAIYLEELARYTPWALKMYDASVKIPSGIITGNYKQLGNYDECLQVESDHGISGQSCSATIQFEVAEDNGASRELDLGDLLVNVAVASNATKWRSGNTIIYEWMWCVPSSCNHSEVQEFLEITLDPLKVEGRVDFVINVPIKSCRTLKTERTTFDPSDWIYISILVIFSLIIIASTTFDIARRGHSSSLNPKGKKYILFSSFSFYTNWKNLFNTDRHQDSVACLDGLRFLSICWIIYGHTYYMEVMGINMDLTQVPKMHESWSKMLVLNGNMVTDTFFLLSGVLLAYTEVIKKEKSSSWKLDVIGLYLHRYSRLTPAYAMMIGFYATIYSKFGSGPHWDVWVGSNRDYCRDNWWSNLLYVNNYVNVPDMCMSQSWYLATDMQLIWLSPIFLYPMLKPARRIFFWIVIGFAFVLSMLLPFAVTFIYRYTATMFYYKGQEDMANVFLNVYTRVYTRAGPYIIGLALGYLLAKRRSYDLKLRMDCLPSLEHERCISISTPTTDWRLASTLACTDKRSLLPSLGSYSQASMDMQMYAFLGNLSFTMALSILWSLSFEIPFMILDRTYLSRKRKTKDDRAKVFGSTDSKKEIYRTTEDSSSSTVAEIYKNVTNSENIRSTCDSEETVDYYVIDEEARNKGVISSEDRTKDENCGDCIYVIGASELDDNRNSLDRSDLEEGRTRTERI